MEIFLLYKLLENINLMNSKQKENRMNYDQANDVKKAIEYYFTPLTKRSILGYKIPIVLLDIVQNAYNTLSIKNHCRFRGPRKGLDNRTKIQQKQDCVKKFATHFTVYQRR